MSDKIDDPWAEAPVIEREGYQLRGSDDPREEWRTVLLVAAMIIILSAIAAESFGGNRLDAQPAKAQLQSR